MGSRQERRVARAAWERYAVPNVVNCEQIPVKHKAKSSVDIPYMDDADDAIKTNMCALLQHACYPPTAFAPNRVNEIQALNARVLKETPVVDPIIMGAFVQWVKTNYRHLFPGLRKRRPVSLDTYLENSNASPSVKETIKRAREECDNEGIEYSNQIPQRDAFEWTSRKSFVKVENALYTSPMGETVKAPRLIQGADPRFIAYVGPCFQAIQSEIKKCWGKRWCVYFTSGATAKQTANYITDAGDWRWFENDVSAYDASINEELCKLEVWLAKKMGAPPLVLQLMEHNMMTHGYTSTGIKYSCVGTRKSGDPYTSCYNSVLNGLMHLFCISVSGVEPADLPKVVKMLVQGDDNLLRHAPHLEVNWDLLLHLGFKCESIYRTGPEEAEFCSSRLYPVEGGYCFGPKLGRYLNKLLNFVNPPINTHPLSVVHGIALGMSATATYIPILRSVQRKLLEWSDGHDPYYVTDEFWKLQYRSQRPDWPACHNFVDDVYGLSAELMEIIHYQIKHWQPGNNIDTPAMCLLFDRDTAAPCEIYC